MEFCPDGELLVGLSKGYIAVMSVENGLNDQYPTNMSVAESDQRVDSTVHMIVSADGKHFVCSDSNNCVSLFIKDHVLQDPEQEIAWNFWGKVMSHTVEISSIAFSNSLDENDQLQPLNSKAKQ